MTASAALAQQESTAGAEGIPPHTIDAVVSCAACHGADGSGNKQLNAPAIRGQHDWYIVRQLENNQHGLRGQNERDTYGVQMAPIVKSLNGREDFIDLAAYINTL